jgi:hypothetical protein
MSERQHAQARKIGGLGGRHDNSRRLTGALLQIIVGQQASFASGVTNNDSSLLGRLDVGLEVAPDAISYSHERKGFFIEYVAIISSQLKESFCQLVVVLLLLNSVVKSRVTKIFFPVCNEKCFQLKIEK